MISFGPVPSRRLGQSLGINNIPPKICTYACVYCQVGKTVGMQVNRSHFYDPEEIYTDVRTRVEKAQKRSESIDYLTFVPDGEPTLDANLGRTIELLKPLGFKIAVITNGSLIWREDVRADLAKADCVSFKIDSIREKTWRRINRPQRALKSQAILGDMLKFADSYSGTLITETMLIKSLNDDTKSFREIARFLNHLQPVRAYLAIPTRPPAEKWVRPPEEDIINEAFQILNEKPYHVEYLIGYEGDAFVYTGDVERDLLSIMAVHPMREQAVSAFLKKAGEDWSIIRRMMASNAIIKTAYGGKKFYLRNFPRITAE
jgi:wyosine [tRNA(Phe)-imidazoG37] synthetase (radical SAM superfamily)